MESSRSRIVVPFLGTLLAMTALRSAVVEPAFGQSQSTASIQGKVISRANVPISEAEVSIVGTAKSALTDSAGAFVIRGISPGDIVLRVRRIGFKGQHLRVALGPGESRGTEIMLDPGPQLLPEIAVTAKEAKPLEFAWTTKYDDFFRRRFLGLPGGTFVSADAIKQRTAIYTHELLEQYVPGVRVIVHFLGEEGTEVLFPRCSRATGYVGVWVDGKRLNFQSEHQEAPSIYNRALETNVGGTSGVTPGKSDPGARRRATQLGDVLAHIPPNEIQFMEVYRGIGSIPAEYSGGCGAIVIWTK